MDPYSYENTKSGTRKRAIQRFYRRFMFGGIIATIVVGDAFTTYYGLSKSKYVFESNKLVRMLIDSFGLLNGIILLSTFKLIFFTLCFILLLKLEKVSDSSKHLTPTAVDISLSTTFVIGVIVVLNNVLVIT